MLAFGIADDTTGALELGACFADAGLRSAIVTTEHVHGAKADALVVDARTRHLPPEHAAHTIRSARVQGSVPWIYHKSDSTLRGNIEAELLALLSVFPEREIVYTPAYPSLGREVRGNTVFVNGTLLENTAYARDGLNPADVSLLKRLSGVQRIRVWEGALEDCARACAVDPEHTIAAGSAGLATLWVQQFRPHTRTHARIPPRRKWVVVCGSRHPNSRQALMQSPFPVIASPEEPRSDPRSVARDLALAALSSDADGLIVAGGDTAAAVADATGAPMLVALGSLRGGLAVSQACERIIISKAGGFGGPDWLCDLARTIRESDA